MFASQTQATVPIPFDPPHTVTVRKLTGRELENAQEAHRSTLATGSPRSWAATFRRALEKGSADPEVIKAIADPLTGYDRYALVAHGLLAWTYPQVIAVPDQTSVTYPTAAATRQRVIDDLDDEGLDFIAREVLRLTKPALFLTLDEAQAERKNDSGSSIVP